MVKYRYEKVFNYHILYISEFESLIFFISYNSSVCCCILGHLVFGYGLFNSFTLPLQTKSEENLLL